MLTYWGMKPTLAPGANQAMAYLLRAAAEGEPYPVVLLDAMMPGMDGFELAQWIHAQPELGAMILLMLSSAGRSGDADRCKELGIDTYLTKPVKQSELLRAILTALRSPMEPAATAAPGDQEAAPATGLGGLKVLLAEDNAVNQRLAVRLLEKDGHTVKVVACGHEAVAAVAKEKFDVVLMDVQMPEMDGLTAASCIRAKERAEGGHVPIVAMTAHAMKGDRERCLAAGMDDYVPKPIQARDLRAAIERQRQSENCDAGAIDKVRAGADRPDAGLDLRQALAFVGGDETLLQEVIQLFLKECPRLAQCVRDAVDNGDARKLWISAHTLKGSVSNFGASEAAALADRLQVLGHEGKVAEAGPLVDALDNELNRIKPALAAWANGAIRCG
jgi:CheY-like chemotaxis protein